MSSGFDFSAFIAGFQEEAEERLQAIESTLVDLEKGQMDADQLEKLRRDAHSVKGSANMLQLRDIGETAHVLEDTFAYLRDGAAVPDQVHINFMFELLDGLRNRIQEADDPQADHLDPDNLRERLENLEPSGEAAAEETGHAESAGEGEGASAEEETSQAEAPEPEDGPEGDAQPARAEGEAEGEAAEPNPELDAALDDDLDLGVPEEEPAEASAPGTDAAGEAGAVLPDGSEPEGPIPAGSEPEAEAASADSGEGAAETEAPGREEPDSGVAGIDRSNFIPGLREEASPTLDGIEDLLGGPGGSEEASDRLLEELESLATSARQVGLEDVCEALELVAAVLESPAAAELPGSLKELLQGLVGRVRKRLETADQEGARSLDLDRIRQARELLQRWGMVRPDGGDPEALAASSAEERSLSVPRRPNLEPDPASEGDAGGEDRAGPFEELGGAPTQPVGTATEREEAGPAGDEAGEQGAGGGGHAAQQSQTPNRSGMDVSAFLDGFQAEAREDLGIIQDGLLHAERGELGEETLNQMAQRAHSLKGSANMLGLNDLGEGSEVLEDGLVMLRSGNLGKTGIDTLLGLHDVLQETTDQVQEDDRPRVDAAGWERKLQEAPAKESEPPGAEPAEGGPEADEAPEPSGDETAVREAAPRTEQDRPETAEEGPRQAGEAQPASAEGAGRRKPGSNRGTLRVSAERLERLSEGVIGLAMDRATQEDRREELDSIASHFREMRRQWEWFENILPETGPLVAQRDKLSEQLQSLTQKINDFRQQSEYDIAARHALYDEIHQRVMDLQVSPLGTIFSVLPRSARDLAQRLEKRVELNIDGSEIELERKNIDALLEPLVHLVTNAISHGIEDPQERKAAGKDPVGHIWVSAEHIGGEVAISVQDDGRGIDYEKVRETAIRTGVTTAAEAENMLPYDLLQMLFRPGFSTKEEVSQVSGRGIGMNAVRDAVQRMTGSIHVDSEVGQGSSFILNIPVSTAVQRILKFRVGNETFGVLANQVERIMTLEEAILTESRGQRFFLYNDNQVPATWLADLFNIPDDSIQDTRSLSLVVVRHLEGYIGFVVNEVLEETQAVVKDVTNYLRRHAVQGLIGTTISGSGEVQLLLEPTGIKEMERTSPITMHVGEAPEEDPLQGLRVLLVEDSPLARQMEKSVLENSGMEVDTAVDGLDALDRMEVQFPDIVISDVEMPRMDGYDLLRKLRDDDRYRGVPVFMVTSRDSQEDRNTAQRLGADGFLNKLDLQSGDLIEEIRQRLEHLYA